ncbi:YbaN family protein [Marinivivus vitaminiproducens]|uniref:YbaN family protein n=1 Tax=Marinivivus vitaminiproducens TaxID=3035935 RepID=UPI0027997B1B|nr:YbaN family protein [Geminicoccaceae bacterium SCSIO 64248]
MSVPEAATGIRRLAYLGLGWVGVALGAIGVVVPGMPTTIFLLIALWAFARSSPRFAAWLYGHRLFGPPLRNWHEHGVIPVRAKVLAIATMAASLAILAAFGLVSLWILVAVGAVMLAVAVFIVTRPARPSVKPSPEVSSGRDSARS